MKNRKNHRTLFAGIAAILTFLLWTAAVSLIDVRAIGPRGSSVGFAALNGWVHDLTGVHMGLYTVTDWLGLVPLGIMFGFGVLGFVQLVKRRSLRRVDASILILGAYYFILMAIYLFFESVVINYRPVLIDGFLEASYPSSTTLLVLGVMPTAVMQLKGRMKNQQLWKTVAVVFMAFTVFMVIGRFISGVHWFTDIIASLILSAGLVMLYDGAVGCVEKV